MSSTQDWTIVGKVVKTVRFLTNEELASEGWARDTAAIVFNDNSIVYAASDFEGNDGGALIALHKGNSYDVYPFKTNG
jgi:hypothetical protein